MSLITSFRKSMKAQILAIVLALVLFSMIAAIIVTSNTANEMLLSFAASRSANILNLAVESLDLQAFEEFTRPEQMSDPRFQRMQESLRELRAISGATYLYTLKRQGGNYIYVIDGLDSTSRDFSALGDIEDELTVPLAEAFAGKESMLFSETSWGTLFTVSRPIMNPQGRVLGVIALDFDVADLLETNLQGLKKLGQLALLLFLLSIGVTFLLVSRLMRPIHALAEKTLQVAEGDFTVDVDVVVYNEVDGLKRGLIRLIRDLGVLIRQIIETGDSLRNTSELVSSATGQTDQSILQISSTADDFAHTVTKLSQFTQTMKQSTKEISQMAAEGTTTLSDAVSQAEAVRADVEGLQAIISNLEQRSRQIDRIIAVINNISKQTNILALNASIEAARAGEQGKGFAIVAEEVRDLAEQSSKSTGEIATLIGDVQKDTSRASVSVTATVENVTQNSLVMGRTNTLLTEILSVLHTTNDQMDTLVSSVTSIESNSEELSATTAEQTAISASVARSADNLLTLADDLQDLLTKFKTS